jgi:hypothetical protein
MPLNVIVRGLPNNMTTYRESLQYVIFYNLFLTAIHFLQHLFSTTVTLMFFSHNQQETDLEFCITTYLRTYLQKKKTEIMNRLQARLFAGYFVLNFIL